MNDKMDDATRDAELLDAFFASHREHIADEGFSERVMGLVHAQPRRAALGGVLRRRVWMDVAAVLAAFGLLVLLGGYARLWEGVLSFLGRCSSAVVAWERGDALVDVMLLLHRLPEMLPSPTQVAGLAMATLVLGALALGQRLEKA